MYICIYVYKYICTRQAAAGQLAYVKAFIETMTETKSERTTSKFYNFKTKPPLKKQNKTKQNKPYN